MIWTSPVNTDENVARRCLLLSSIMSWALWSVLSFPAFRIIDCSMPCIVFLHSQSPYCKVRLRELCMQIPYRCGTSVPTLCFAGTYSYRYDLYNNINETSTWLHWAHSNLKILICVRTWAATTLVVMQDGTDQDVMNTARGFSKVKYLQVAYVPLLVSLCGLI